MPPSSLDLSPAKASKVTRKRGKKYAANWKDNSHTLADTSQGHLMTRDYYELTTDNYLHGWGPNLHYCRFHRDEFFAAAQARHQHKLAMAIGITPGSKVLDVGCGVGGVARGIAWFTGARVTGLNITQVQIDKARQLTEHYGLSKQVDFVLGDFHKMPFADNTFDYAFDMESIIHATDLHTVYSELYRVLKPGGVFGGYEECLTRKYNPANPAHAQVVADLQRGAGMAKVWSIDEVHDALARTPFRVLREEDEAVNEDTAPWYYPLYGQREFIAKGDTENERRCFFLRDGVVKWGLRWVRFAERIGIMREGETEAFRTMKRCVEGYREGGRLGVFSPMWLVVCQKPEEGEGLGADVVSESVAAAERPTRAANQGNVVDEATA